MATRLAVVSNAADGIVRQAFLRGAGRYPTVLQPVQPAAEGANPQDAVGFGMQCPDGVAA